MPLKLKPLPSPTPSQYTSLAQIRWAAFSDNPLNQILYPSSTAAEVIPWLIRREQRVVENPNQILLVVEDTTSADILAYAKWELPRDEKEQEGEREERDIPTSATIPAAPEVIQMDLWNEFREKMGVMKKKYSDPRQCKLHTLVTDPRHTGRGCASMLLKWGIEKVDNLNAQIYLEATPAAYPMYRKYGWEEVDRFMLDLGKYGGEGLHPVPAMIREPRKGEGR
ncbi:hypothetical protein B7463_g724, partial [Scytalidium lignicola]